MATKEEKIAAVTAALNALSTADRQNSAHRFVASFDALMALQPTQPAPIPGPVPTQSPEATVLITFQPTAEMRPDVDRISKELLEMVQKVQATPPPPQSDRNQ